MFCLSDSSPSGTVSLGLKSFSWRPPPHQATEACFSLPLSSPKTSFWTLWVSYTFPYYCLVSWLVRGVSRVKACLLSFDNAWIDDNIPVDSGSPAMLTFRRAEQLCSKSLHHSHLSCAGFICCFAAYESHSLWRKLNQKFYLRYTRWCFNPFREKRDLSTLKPHGFGMSSPVNQTKCSLKLNAKSHAL